MTGKSTMKRWQQFQLASIALVVLAATGCQTLDTAKGWLSKKKTPYGLSQRTDDQLQDDSFDPMGRRAGNRILLEDLAPSQIRTTLQSKSFGGTVQQRARELFAEGRRLYDEASAEKQANPQSTAQYDLFSRAAGQFKLAASRWPDSSLEEDALFFEGESLFFAR